MIVSCRLFKLERAYPLEELQRKLKGKKMVETANEGFELLTFIKDIRIEENDLYGLLIYESLLAIPQADGATNWVKEANQVKFVFSLFGNSLFFIPFAGSSDAESAAMKINNAVFNHDVILKQTFSPNVIEKFLHRNPHTLRRGIWAELNLPGISKASLTGSNLLRSPDSGRYDRHGRKSFVMVTLKENGWTISLSQTGGIAFYREVSEEERLQFVKDKILPLL